MPWATIIGSVAGGLLSSGAASDAADAQAGAAASATAEQKRQYDTTRADFAPYRAAGTSALSKLSDLLGLTVPAQSTGELRATLAPQFTTPGTPGTPGGYFGGGREGDGNTVAATPGTPATIDHAGLDAAVLAAQPANAVPSAEFGSLLRPFTGADLASEPGYQFGLAEGTKGLNNSLAARGGLYSGAAGKAITRYGQDYAGTKFNEAFNRDQTTKTGIFNKLSGVAGTGQTATGQVASAGQNYANNAAGNLIGAGDARATGYLAQGNIWGNAINQGVSAWNNRPQQPQQPQQWRGFQTGGSDTMGFGGEY